MGPHGKFYMDIYDETGQSPLPWTHFRRDNCDCWCWTACRLISLIKVLVFIQISLKLIPPDAIDKESARYFQIMNKRKLGLYMSLQWRHNGRGGVSDHQLHDCLLNHLFSIRSKGQYCWKCFHLRTSSWWVPMAVMMKDGHDDVMKWKHFPRYWPFVRGIHRSPVNSPHKGHWRGALMFSLICIWINGWVNNREAGDLKRHRAHYEVIVMVSYYLHYYCL